MRIPSVLLTLVLAVLLPSAKARSQEILSLADQAREVLRQYCAECHGHALTARGDIRLLDPEGVRPLLTPGSPETSELMLLVQAGAMPPGTRAKVPAREQKILHDWIAGGAQPFIADSSDDYARQVILQDVRAASGKGDRNLALERYITFNHLLANPEQAQLLPAHRAALTRALAHLTWQARLAAPVPVDPTGSVLRVRLDELGWDATPFAGSDGPINPTQVNLYDLLLLEYPYASIQPGSPLQQQMISDYLARVKLLRPIGFVRGDWLITTALRSPLYEDLLQLPLTITGLEQRLEYQPTSSIRAATTSSRVLRFPRILERHASDRLIYWRTHDLTESRDTEGLLAVADQRSGLGGELLFSLPSGLPAFLSTNARGERLAGIRPSLLHEELASKGPLLTGLACIRCHSSGVQPVTDVIHPALDSSSLPRETLDNLRKLYPGQKTVDQLVKGDTESFRQALARLPDQPADGQDPLGVVIDRYEQQLSSIIEAAGPLVLNPQGLRGSTLTDRGLRDVLVEERLEEAIRRRLSGEPLLPVDGLTHPQRNGTPHLLVDFSFRDYDTDRPRRLFHPGDKMVLVARNATERDIYCELIYIDGLGRKIPLLPPTVLGPDKEIRVPNPKDPRGAFIRINEDEGIEHAVLYVSDREFPAGVVLKVPGKKPGDMTPASHHVVDRIVHPFYQLSTDKRTIEARTAEFDPARLSKITIEMETRKK